jgi:hypothetical protein
MRIIREVLGNRLLTTDVVNTLSGPDFPTVPNGWGVTALLLHLNSASFSIQNLNRIRMKAGSFVACDFNPVGTFDYFTTLIARFAENRADTITDASTALTLKIPFNLFDRLDDASQDLCQLPRGQPLQLDLGITGSPVAPTVRVGLEISNVKPAFASQFLGWTINVANGATNGQVSRAPTNGVLRALGLPLPNATLTNAANPTRWRVTHARAGDLLPGNSPGIIMAAQRLDNKFTETSVLWLPIGDDNGLPTGPNELTIEVDTGSTTLAAVEAALWQIIPTGKEE